ncbi:hypothetical protein [Clostridium saccharoperbutylacetonicum]|uniref:hypothetical protein n=1 Tax=Clostridium saccharoperbutylacetonicum TaxID=36745 RepID=UPI0039EB6F59
MYEKNQDVKTRNDGYKIKSSEYKKMDIFEFITPLADGETIELKDIYIGCLYYLDLAKIGYSKYKWKLQYLFNTRIK